MWPPTRPPSAEDTIARPVRAVSKTSLRLLPSDAAVHCTFYHPPSVSARQTPRGGTALTSKPTAGPWKASLSMAWRKSRPARAVASDTPHRRVTSWSGGRPALLKPRSSVLSVRTSSSAGWWTCSRREAGGWSPATATASTTSTSASSMPVSTDRLRRQAAPTRQLSRRHTADADPSTPAEPRPLAPNLPL